jgi:AcrR family transcriptional regulator
MQNRYGTMPRWMKASGLCRESGLSRSAIHYYISLGLLHRPRKAGLNLHLYDETHVARLRQIRQLKEQEHLSLAEIKQVFAKGMRQGRSGPPSDEREEGRQPTESSVGVRGGTKRGEDRENREKILDMAIKLFSEKGYEGTKIIDITDALRMGKSTFYVYFRNKRDLFMECIDRLGVAMVPRESWDEIRRERDYFRKNQKRGAAFLRAFPGYGGILNMIRGAIGRSDPLLAQKATEAFRVLSNPLLKDLRRAVANGTVHTKYDEALVAYLHLVIADGFGYWRMIDPRYSVEEGIEIITDVFENGLVKRNPSPPKPVHSLGPSGDATDRTGMRMQLENISFQGTCSLPGRMGEAEVAVDLQRLASVKFRPKGEGLLLADLKMEDGQKFTIEVDGDVSLSGLATLGSVRLPLRRVSSVSLRPQETR